jgi:hypothetical protein
MEGEIAYSMALIREMAGLYDDAEHGFTCKVGYPVSSTGRNGPGQFPSQVPVLLQVRPGFQKTFGSKCYNRLKKYDRPELSIGNPISGLVNSFTVHTYKQGHWRPLQLQLGPGASAIWGMLWSENSIRLTIYNKLDEEIYSEEQSANQGPSILSSIVSPPTLHYQPEHRLILPTEDLAFNGGRLHLNGTRGWLFMFDIRSMPPEAYRQMHRAEAEFIIEEDTEQAIDEAATEIENLVRQMFGGGQQTGAGAGPEGEAMPEDDMMMPPEEDMPPPP